MKNKCPGKVFQLETRAIRYYGEVLNERINAVHKERSPWLLNPKKVGLLCCFNADPHPEEPDIYRKPLISDPIIRPLYRSAMKKQSFRLLSHHLDNSVNKFHLYQYRRH